MFRYTSLPNTTHSAFQIRFEFMTKILVRLCFFSVDGRWVNPVYKTHCPPYFLLDDEFLHVKLMIIPIPAKNRRKNIAKNISATSALVISISRTIENGAIKR